MEKNYKSLGELLEKYGVGETAKHKYLEFRDKSPVLDKFLSYFDDKDSLLRSQSYDVRFNEKGRIAYFDPNTEEVSFIETGKNLCELARDPKLVEGNPKIKKGNRVFLGTFSKEWIKRLENNSKQNSSFPVQ